MLTVKEIGKFFFRYLIEIVLSLQLLDRLDIQAVYYKLKR